MGSDPDFSCDIRFITRKWPPAMGGMETYSRRLADELAKDHRLEILALPGRDSGAAPGALRLLGFGLATALRLLVSRPARVVHLGDVACWPLGWIAGWRHRGSRVVLSAHGSDISLAARRGLRALLYRAYLRLGAALMGEAVLVANSRWLATLAERHGFRRTVVVPLGTDARPHETPSAPGGHLLFAGRIARRKGLSFLVREVLPLIPHPMRVRVAGTVWDEAEAEILRSPHVDHLGRLDAASLGREYAEALCVVVPSLEPEGFGLVAIEAAAAGGVVLASAHSGLAEAVVEGSGFLAECGDASAWARKLEEIRGWSAERRADFVRGATAMARSRFGWSRVAEETARAYELARPRSGSARSLGRFLRGA